MTYDYKLRFYPKFMSAISYGQISFPTFMAFCYRVIIIILSRWHAGSDLISPSLPSNAMIAPSTYLDLKIMTGYDTFISFASSSSHHYHFKIKVATISRWSIPTSRYKVSSPLLSHQSWFLRSVSAMGKSGTVNRVEPSTVDQSNEAIR